MPAREVVDRFIAAVRTEQHADAIAAFYAEHATMQEVESQPRVGLANLVAREQAVLAAIATVKTHEPDFVAIDGDHVALHWVFEFTGKDGKHRIVDEMAMQVWEGDPSTHPWFSGVARHNFRYLLPSLSAGTAVA